MGPLQGLYSPFLLVTPRPPLPPRDGGERAERDRAPRQREISPQGRGTKCPGSSRRGPVGGTREAGERGNRARRASPQPQQVNKNATGRKESSHSLATKAVKRDSAGPPLQRRGKTKLDYMATTRPQVKLPSGRQRRLDTDWLSPRADEDPPSSTAGRCSCPPPSSQKKYFSEPTTTTRRLSTRLSARALEPKEAHSRQ